MKRVFLTLTIVAVLLSMALSVQAQEATPIVYGDSVTGLIDNAAPETLYTFDGAEGDVIIIEMGAVDALGELSAVMVKLLDPTGAEIGAVDSFATVVFAAKLATSGAYTIVATRYDETSTGEFFLNLIQPPALEVGSTVDGDVSNESSAYFVYDSEEPFVLSYTQVSGDFHPQVAVNIIGGFNAYYTNGLSEVATLQGSLLTSGTLSITPNADVATGPYIISFSEALFDFNFDVVTAQFTVGVTQ